MLTDVQKGLISSQITSAKERMAEMVAEQQQVISNNLKDGRDPYHGIPDNYVLGRLIEITIESCVEAVISQVKVQSGITVELGATAEDGDLILE